MCSLATLVIQVEQFVRCVCVCVWRVGSLAVCDILVRRTTEGEHR